MARLGRAHPLPVTARSTWVRWPFVATLVDPFDGVAVDTGLWGVDEDGGATASVSGGLLHLDVGGSGGLVTLTSLGFFDLTESAIYWQVTPVAGAVFVGGVADEEGDGVEIAILGTDDVEIWAKLSSGDVLLDTVAYDPDLHRQFRVRIEGTTQYVEAAGPDGSWAELASGPWAGAAEYDPYRVQFFVTNEHDGTDNAVATVDGVNVSLGGTVEEADGASAGSASASGIGAAVAASVGAATGTATPTAVSGATAGSVGASDGVATVAGVSGATAGSVGASAGTATPTADSGAIAGVEGSAAGVGTVAAVGVTLAGAVGAADGIATPTAVSGATAGVVGSSAGVATAAAAGEDAAATGGEGAAAGVATCSGVGAALFAGVGASAGAASPTAVGAAVAQGVGASDGAASVAGVGALTFASVGSAGGSASVVGITVYYVLGVGSSSGVAVCLAVGEDGAALPIALIAQILGQPRYAATPDGGPRYEGTLQ